MTDLTNSSQSGAPTRTPGTEQANRKTWVGIQKRARAFYDMDPSDPISADRVVDYMIGLKDTQQIKTNSWRVYKAAAAQCLAEAADAGDDEAGDALERLRAEPQTGAIRAGIRLPDQVWTRKNFPDKDFDRLIEHIKGSSSTYRPVLVYWLQSARITGLRPCEWVKSEYLEYLEEAGGPALKVMNAKATNGRGNGKYRHIDLSGITEAERAIVQTFVRVIQAADRQGLFDKVRQACQKLLRRSNIARWPNRMETYSLYSCRHQASADYKQAHDREGVAALMGHASNETATLHYGRRVSGRKGVGDRIKPLESEKLTVRDVASRTEARRFSLRSAIEAGSKVSVSGDAGIGDDRPNGNEFEDHVPGLK